MNKIRSDFTAVGSLVGDEEWLTGPSFEVRDPGRLAEVVGTVCTADASDIDRVVQVARQAQKVWAKSDVADRASLILRAAEELEINAAALSILMTRENGSVLGNSSGELVGAVAALRNSAEFGVALLAEDRTFADDSSWVKVERRPYGVVGCIVPWNAPVVLTMQKIAPALMAGNTVIVKPSPFAPLAVSVILKHFAELFPVGVINVVHGDGAVGSALISHPKIRKISFTGGTATAKTIMRAAAESLTKVHFELGGNDAAIVLDDADLALTADRIADQAFRRAGQFCYAIKRVYVPTGLAAEFNQRLLARVRQIAVGYGLDHGSGMGPLNNKTQFEKIKALHEGLAASGATVQVTGSQLNPQEWREGYYFQPAIVFDADPESDIVKEEQFGPILPVVSYESEDEAVAMTNDTEYGLGSSVWSSDPERAVALSSKIEAGMTFINGHGLTPLGQKHMPFGGIKQSGMGWENSPHGLAEYLEFHSLNVFRQAEAT